MRVKIISTEIPSVVFPVNTFPINAMRRLIAIRIIEFLLKFDFIFIINTPSVNLDVSA